MFDLSELVTRHALERPDKIALADPDGTITYREFEQRVRRAAQGLRTDGVEPGDRVAYLGRNSIDYFELLVAAARIGAVMASINWRLAASDIAGLVQDSTAEVVFADSDLADRVPSDVRRLVLTGDAYAAWRDVHEGDDVRHPAGPDTVVAQSYTSGTTGRAKGVLVTNEMFDWSVRSGPAGFGITEDSVIAAIMPIYHMGGAVMFAYTVAYGATAVSMGAFEPDGFLDLIEEHRISFIALAPVMLSMILAAQEARPRDLSSVDSVLVAGQAPTARQVAQFSRLDGVSVLQGYGSTEFWGLVTTIPVQDMTGPRASSAGRPFDWIEIAVFDPTTGQRLGVGEKGELRGRTRQATRGYWQRPEESAGLRSEDGWMRTGDIAHLDADGYLFLTDRVKDMIITGGENVYPVEVERVLIEHPAVRDVAVVAGPHEKWGEAVTAFVVTRPSASLTPEELIAWSRERLAGFQRPQQVLIVDALPVNATGKVLKTTLRQRLREQVRSD